jgi:hypothetical protein
VAPPPLLLLLLLLLLLQAELAASGPCTVQPPALLF